MRRQTEGRREEEYEGGERKRKEPEITPTPSWTEEKRSRLREGREHGDNEAKQE